MTRCAGGRSGENCGLQIWHEQRTNSEKLHKIAHKKRSCQNRTKSRRTREKSSEKYNEKKEVRTPRNAIKCNAKKEHRTESEARERQFCNTNTGAGWMLREFMYTIRARQIGAACCPCGEFMHTVMRACPAAGVSFFTRICAGEIATFATP